jgi:hypothetical protein
MWRVLVHDNKKKSLQNNSTLCYQHSFHFFYKNTMGFSNNFFLTSLNRYSNFLVRNFFLNGPNWKDTHLYITPFYFSQDFLRRKNSQRNKFIWTFENHMYMLVLKLNLDFEVLRSNVCRFKNNMFFILIISFCLKIKIILLLVRFLNQH